MKIEIKKIIPRVYVLSFDNQYDLCMSFVRLQEFQESQKFRNKYFTFEEFIDYWSKNFGGGSFNYPFRCNGFNLSGDVIEKWLVKFGGKKMGIGERKIISKIYSIIKKTNLKLKDIYVIGIHKENSAKNRNEILSHELKHAMYYLSSEYRTSCEILISKMSREAFKKSVLTLIKMGYGRNVLKDEMQAYFSTESTSNKKILKQRKAFVDNFKKFIKNDENKE